MRQKESNKEAARWGQGGGKEVARGWRGGVMGWRGCSERAVSRRLGGGKEVAWRQPVGG